MERIEVIPASGIAAQHAVPGSKSYTNRALTIAAVADGRSTLRGALASDDTRVARAALESLGIAVDAADDTFRVHGHGWPLQRTGCAAVPGQFGHRDPVPDRHDDPAGVPQRHHRQRAHAGASHRRPAGRRCTSSAPTSPASAATAARRCASAATRLQRRPCRGVGRHQQPVSVRPSHGGAVRAAGRGAGSPGHPRIGPLRGPDPGHHGSLRCRGGTRRLPAVSHPGAPGLRGARLRNRGRCLFRQLFLGSCRPSRADHVCDQRSLRFGSGRHPLPAGPGTHGVHGDAAARLARCRTAAAAGRWGISISTRSPTPP